MTSDELPECPLCMVELFYDDLGFYPCSCGYQICRFCWSKILNEENGLCPACRRAYDSEAPASFTPLSEEQFQKLKREKRQKERKNKTIENRRHLADIRVVQKNLAFVIGLPQRFADHPETLKTAEYFGKYGKVFKVVVNRNATQPGSQNQSTVGAYVTFVKDEDTIHAILDLNKQQMEGRTLKASLGTTKYCSQFLKGASCTKGECMYLHELGEQAASFTKEEMQQNKHTEYERKLIEDYIEQTGTSTESRLTASSTSLSTQQHSSHSQSGNRHQHSSECRDHSSSSSNSNSNTPPSSRRQTKSESHTQAHRQSQQSHHGKHNQSNHKSGGGSANATTSSGDSLLNSSSSAQTSQRTPRKNSQNYKSQAQNSHSRQQKQQKRQNQQQQQQQQHQQQQQNLQQQQQNQQQQQHQQQNQQQQQLQQQQQQQQQNQQQQQQQAQQHSTQSSQGQFVANQNQKPSQCPSIVTSTAPATSLPPETSSCTPTGDPGSVTVPPTLPSDASFTDSTSMSLSSALLMSLEQQAGQHSMPGSGPSLAEENLSVSGAANNSGTVPASSGVSATSSNQLQSPMLPLRPHAQVLNGLSGSSVGLSPYSLPMYSIQCLLEQQRLQQQQQKQREFQQHLNQSIMNSFDSQCVTSTSFSPDQQTKQTDLSVEQSADHQYKLPPGHSSHWAVADAAARAAKEPSSSASNSLSNNTISAQDDVANLDFDPVKESQQALAVLLEHERNNGSSTVPPGTTPGYLSNHCAQPQLTPPPGFELPPFPPAIRPSALRAPNFGVCHPGMLGYGYYSSGVPPGAMDMGIHGNEACSNRTDNSMNIGSNLRIDRPSHLPTTNSTCQPSVPAPPSPGLPFSVKALQDTLRCVLPEETNITFDPSLMREMQYQQFQQSVTTTAAATTASHTNTGPATQISIDAISSESNSRGPLSQSLDAMANSSSKEPQPSLWPHNGFCLDDDPAVVASAPGVSHSLQHEYCSLWPQTPATARSKTDATAVETDLCLRSDAVWSSPTTPPGFGSSMLSYLGGITNSSVHSGGSDGQRSAISVDTSQTSVTATGDQQQAVNKL